MENTSGEGVELRPKYYQTAGDREFLLRLQNNTKQRAVEVIERILLFTPDQLEL